MGTTTTTTTATSDREGVPIALQPEQLQFLIGSISRALSNSEQKVGEEQNAAVTLPPQPPTPTQIRPSRGAAMTPHRGRANPFQTPMARRQATPIPELPSMGEHQAV